MVRLDWAGREETAIRRAGSPPRAKLRKVPELSTGEDRSANAIIRAAVAEWYDRPSGLRSKHLRRGLKDVLLIEADDRARTCIPRRFAEAPGVLSDYDFYTLMLHHRAGLILPNLASAPFARHGSKGQ